MRFSASGNGLGSTVSPAFWKRMMRAPHMIVAGEQHVRRWKLVRQRRGKERVLAGAAGSILHHDGGSRYALGHDEIAHGYCDFGVPTQNQVPESAFSPYEHGVDAAPIRSRHRASGRPAHLLPARSAWLRADRSTIRRAASHTSEAAAASPTAASPPVTLGGAGTGGLPDGTCLSPVGTHSHAYPQNNRHFLGKRLV